MTASAENRLCCKPAAAFVPAWGWSFACVLAPGHAGECQPGGDCIAHGPYTMAPGVPPQCPYPIEECLRIILAWDKDLMEWENRERRKLSWGGLAKHV